MQVHENAIIATKGLRLAPICNYMYPCVCYVSVYLFTVCIMFVWICVYCLCMFTYHIWLNVPSICVCVCVCVYNCTLLLVVGHVYEVGIVVITVQGGI